MSAHLDPLDKAFESLKSRGAILGDSFSQSLEDRLMQEHQKQGSRRTRLLLLWIAAGVLALLGGGAASYAATGGFTAWPWTVSVGDDGMVRDEDGEVVGVTTDNEDGSSTTLIQMGEGGIVLESEESLKGKGNLRFFVEP